MAVFGWSVWQNMKANLVVDGLQLISCHKHHSHSEVAQSSPAQSRTAGVSSAN